MESYNLEIWNSVDNKWTELASCNSTSYSVQNLLPDRQYKFRVRAVNMYGVGEPGAESVPVTAGVEKVKGEKESPLLDIWQYYRQKGPVINLMWKGFLKLHLSL